jgi:hypothetical protein
MEWIMSEDNQWRQLGSIVNAVLMDARTKAVRRGTISQAAARPTSRKIVQRSQGFTKEKLGHGFLSQEASVVAGPVQLELPFGIATGSQAGFGSPQAPSTARFM